MKIKIKDHIIDLALCSRITVTSYIIELVNNPHDTVQYKPDRNLTQAEFNTLSAFLLNQSNCPYTVVI